MSRSPVANPKSCHDYSVFIITDLDTSKRTRRHLGNWSWGPAVSMRFELLVAYEKL
jgi:hypothetical protein